MINKIMRILARYLYRKEKAHGSHDLFLRRFISIEHIKISPFCLRELFIHHPPIKTPDWPTPKNRDDLICLFSRVEVNKIIFFVICALDIIENITIEHQRDVEIKLHSFKDFVNFNLGVVLPPQFSGIENDILSIHEECINSGDMRLAMAALAYGLLYRAASSINSKEVIFFAAESVRYAALAFRRTYIGDKYFCADFYEIWWSRCKCKMAFSNIESSFIC